MCGIAGLLNLSTEPLEDPALVNQMARQMMHRGPDDGGYYSDGPVAFGFRRLSIIDVAGGHQPVANEDETVWCMFNGEVYNYLELRHALEQQGHQFKTNSDTETIVHAYEQHGLDFLSLLRGMFAIALWDSRRRRLVLARDRIGKKPLYYSVSRGQLAFGSEMKALLPWPGLNRELDLAALRDFLRFLYVPGPKTIFKAVRKLPPGHFLVAEAESGDWQIRRYWSFNIDPSANGDATTLATALRDRLDEAVRIRLRSDVPLGAFLSGGVDSSAVVALMSRQNLAAAPLTFSMGFESAGFDESQFARLVASGLNTDHREEIVDPVTPETLEKIVWHLDEPFADSSAVPTYLVCKAARRHVTVALSGDGGDEIFGGYDRYRFFRWIGWIEGCPTSMRHWIKRLLLQGAKDAKSDSPFARRLHQAVKAVEASLLPIEDRPFFLNQYFEPSTLMQMLSADVLARANGHSLEREWVKTFSVGDSPDGLDLFLHIDTVLGLPDDMLTKVDRMSMANSLEVRCPLLDQEVIEFAAEIPNRLKVHGRQQKYLLKRAVADLLPSQILKRAKHGFSAPIGTWLQTTFREMVADCLSSDSIKRRGLLVPAEVTAVRDLLLSGRAPTFGAAISEHQRSHRVWALLMFELWARQYLDA